MYWQIESIPEFLLFLFGQKRTILTLLYMLIKLIKVKSLNDNWYTPSEITHFFPLFWFWSIVAYPQLREGSHIGFLFLKENIGCGYLLEALCLRLQLVPSTAHNNYMLFFLEIKKISVIFKWKKPYLEPCFVYISFVSTIHTWNMMGQLYSMLILKFKQVHFTA